MTKAMVSAPQPEAVEAGLDILSDGGNVVDAAIGAALVGYSAEEARTIAGARSERIEELLGYPGRAALAHRDDMVIWGM